MASGTSPHKNTSIFAELNRVVYEYLEITGMNKTLSSFVHECNQKSLPCPSKSKNSNLKSPFSQTDAKKLITTLDTGDLDTFLQKWHLFLSHIQVTSEDMKKLEVYLRVYFGIWPKAHDGTEEDQLKAMASLKAYFEENSSDLSRDPTILPLFALPFVTDPKKHPVFKELFQDLWTDRLRGQLEATLHKYYELLQDNIGYHSKLAAAILKTQNGSEKLNPGVTDVVIQYHQDRFYQLMTTYRKVRKLLRGTRESYGKLLKVSSEMIFGLEEAATGSVMSIEPIIQKCFQIFPELFTPNVDGSGNPDKEYFKRLASAAIFNNILDSDVSLFFIGISDLGPESLNYPKIKENLTSDTVNQSEKLCLLQAIRWLLTKTSTNCREYAMESFTTADLLGLRSKDKEYRQKLFSCMLSQAPTYLKECFARLLNAIASIKSGRMYLAETTHCLDILVKSLITFKGENESYICQMVIATLQKMSLRKQMRLGMIERKVIQWLAVYLKAELAKSQTLRSNANENVEISYNPYLMEYGWALLMNLCLHEEAKPASSAIAADVLTSVVQMLHAEPDPDVAPYVVSTLYSLLRNPDVFFIAKRMRLQDTLKEIVIGNKPTEMNHHLNKLVEVLNLKGYDRITTTGEVEYDDDDNADPEEFEPELEVTEGWAESLIATNYTGDDLLIRQYLIHREIVLPQSPSIKISQHGVHIRPTTPKTTTHVTTLEIDPQDSTQNLHQAIKSTREIQSSKVVKTSSQISQSNSQKFSSSKNKNSSSKLFNQNVKSIERSQLTNKSTPLPSGTNLTNQKPNSPPINPPNSKLRGNNSQNFKKKPPQRFEPTPDQMDTKTPSSILNHARGKYNNFDNGMYTDDIFASVSTSHQSTNDDSGPSTNSQN